MKSQGLMRDAIHIAAMLPEDRKETAIILRHVAELSSWENKGGCGKCTECSGCHGVIELRPVLSGKPQKMVPAAAIFACVLAFTIGWLMDSPIAHTSTICSAPMAGDIEANQAHDYHPF